MPQVHERLEDRMTSMLVAHAGSRRVALPTSQLAEVVSHYDPPLVPLSVPIGSKEANQVEVQAWGEVKLNARSNQELLFGFTPIEMRALLHILRFNADADLIVEH